MNIYIYMYITFPDHRVHIYISTYIYIYTSPLIISSYIFGGWDSPRSPRDPRVSSPGHRSAFEGAISDARAVDLLEALALDEGDSAPPLRVSTPQRRWFFVSSDGKHGIMQGLGLMSLFDPFWGIGFTSPVTSHICWRWNIPEISWVMFLTLGHQSQPLSWGDPIRVIPMSFLFLRWSHRLMASRNGIDVFFFGDTIMVWGYRLPLIGIVVIDTIFGMKNHVFGIVPQIDGSTWWWLMGWNSKIIWYFMVLFLGYWDRKW